MTQLNTPNTELLIKDYFLATPTDRPAQCEFVASYITTVNDVQLVLDQGVRTEDYHNSAVALLGKCDEILIEAFTTKRVTDFLEGDVLTYEIELTILIASIPLATRIPVFKRLEAIINFKPSSCFIEMGIINALKYLKDEIKTNYP